MKLQTFTAALLLVVASGCSKGGDILGGSSESVEIAPFRPLTPPAVQTFELPADKLRLTYLQFILWKKELPSVAEMIEVQTLAAKLDYTNSLGEQINRMRDGLTAQNAEVLAKDDRLAGELKSLTGRLAVPRKKIDRAEKVLAAKYSAFYAESNLNTPNDTILATLRNEIRTQKDLITDQRAIEASLLAEEQELLAQRSALAPQVTPVREQLAQLDEKQAPVSAMGEQFANQLAAASVFPLKQPSSLTIDGPGAESKREFRLEGWNLGDDRGELAYSTQAVSGAEPTIVDTSYQNFGGHLSFTVCVFNAVQTALHSAYRVDLVRANAPDRVIFSGELAKNLAENHPGLNCAQLGRIRISGKTRFGFAKIQDFAAGVTR
jgi:hypothetical protein